jgi:ankyrin repeat protein
MSFLPAGFSDDEDDFGFYFPEEKVYFQNEKSPIEILKENLIKAVKNNDVDKLRFELDNKTVEFDVDSEIDGVWNLLYHACFNANVEMVKFLIEERGVDINKSIKNETALMVACKSHCDSNDVYNVVKLIINDSTLIGASNAKGLTALMFAAKRGHLKVLQHLIACNDAYNALDNDGYNVSNLTGFNFFCKL